VSNPSNLYAEKIFSEHPLALWSLDEQVDYISFISEAQRNLANAWMYSDCTITTDTLDLNQPFPSSIKNLIEFDDFVGASKEITFIGEDLENFNNLNTDYATLTVGSYFYSASPYIKKVSIGFEYTDANSLEKVELAESFNVTSLSQWNFISHTIEYPQQNSNFRPIIKVEFQGGAATTENYQIYINGTTVGQWSEEYNTKSLGTSTISFPSDINLTGITKCVSAKAYGLGTKNGYYLVNDNTLLAKNSGVPIVYGASTVTKLQYNEGTPSLLIPGFGFLNEAGRYNDYTVEMWLKINSDEKVAKKIFGPISSTDGLYVEGAFLTLVIGKSFASHFIGKWYRPMLVQIRLTNNSATLLVNGEQVVSLQISTSDIDLPTEYTNAKSNDWLGFYSYQKINPFEVDCISIYSYNVPEIISKKRWIYGQAVVSPEAINSAYSGISAYIDYPFAEYTANYTYPNFGTWSQGAFDNLSAKSLSLNSPDYSLPDIYLDGLTLDKLYSDCYSVNVSGDKYLTFRPNEDWNNKNTYINFNNSGTILDETHAIYMVFSDTEYRLDDQVLIKFYDNAGNYFKIITQDSDIKYIFNFNGQESTLSSVEEYALDTKLAVGVAIHDLVNYFGNSLTTFFGSQNNLKYYAAGDDAGQNPFLGKIYSLGISTEYNLNTVSDHFNDNGIVKHDSSLELFTHTASYTILPSIAYDTFFLDIGISGYWQDYIPLTYFAKYINNKNGQQYYDIDFLQFNIDYPAPSTSTTTETIIYPYPQNTIPSMWNYEDLDNLYDHPVQRQYAQLDNYLFTGWENYEDAAQKSIKTNQLDTTGASVKSYISLQYIVDGANKTIQTFDNIELVNQSRIIDFSQQTGWSNKVFEVVDNTLIYPPASVDFNDLAIVTHLDFNIRGVLTKPVAIKKLEYASEAFDSESFNIVGTRFGVEMYPYKQSGIYYDYKSKNPFSIYKESTPYLYNTKTSGIEIRGEIDPNINRGIAIPINKNTVSSYRVSAIQTWIRYDFDRFTYDPVQIMEIKHKNDTIKFFAVANSQIGNRARVFAVNSSTGLQVDGLGFYLNGTLVREPIINVKEWAVIGVSFGSAINLDNYLGLINLNGPFTYNNITHYKATSLQEIQSKTYRPWLKVVNDGVDDVIWNYWYGDLPSNGNYTWNGVLVLASKDLYAVNPGDVYKTYIGTNKIIIDTSTVNISFNADRVRIFSDVSWQSSVSTPV
jgi:hypothetical protein